MADEVQSSIEKFMNNTTGMIPSVDSSAQAKEIDIKRAIGGEKVEASLAHKEFDIELPNYVLSLLGVKDIFDYQLKSIEALLNEDGDVTIYLNTGSKLIKIGKGKSEILDRLLALVISSIFGDRALIYKDYTVGEKPKIVSKKDISTMRLTLSML